jgi:hypothetical protein
MLLISGFNAKLLILQSAPVAQLDRASDFESAGRPFESGRVRHFTPTFAITYRHHFLLPQQAAHRLWVNGG